MRHRGWLKSFHLLIAATLIVLGFGQLPALADDEKSTANVDIYVAVHPVPGDDIYFFTYPVLNKDGSYGTSHVTLPASALGKDGIVELNSDFEGAAALRSAIGKTFAGTNAAYGTSNLQFGVRKIYLMKSDQGDLGKLYSGEDQQHDLQVTDGKSGLLSAFSEITKSNTSALRVLVANTTSHGNEQGYAQDGGTAAIVQAENFFNSLDRGFILSHELGHLFNLGHSSDGPFQDIMSEQVPNREHGKPKANSPVHTKLKPEQAAAVNTRLEEGRLNGVLRKPAATGTKQSLYVPSQKNDFENVDYTPQTPVFSDDTAFDWSLSGYVVGSRSFMGVEIPDSGVNVSDVIRLEYAANFVLPIGDNWNLQFAAEGNRSIDEEGIVYNSQAWASTLVYWQDRNLGAVGGELGIRKAWENAGGMLWKAGAVAEYYAFENVLLGGWGGFLFPEDEELSGLDTSAYAGGLVTYYGTPSLAFDATADWSKLEFGSGGKQEFEAHSLRTGLRLRYRFETSGVQAWAGGYYTAGWQVADDEKVFKAEGFQLLGGLAFNITGGGMQPSSIEQSDKVDGFYTPVYQLEKHVTSLSDKRLKANIVAIGKSADGLIIYSWKYKADPATTWVGVMAQDLVVSHPDALVMGADGYYRVRYDKLGVQMMTLEQWTARHL